MNSQKIHKEKGKAIIGKEVVIGIVSMILGGYNILNDLGYLSYNINAPQVVGNVLLLLGGMFLLTQAYKLARHEYHTRRALMG